MCVNNCFPTVNYMMMISTLFKLLDFQPSCYIRMRRPSTHFRSKALAGHSGSRERRNHRSRSDSPLFHVFSLSFAVGCIAVLRVFLGVFLRSKPCFSDEVFGVFCSKGLGLFEVIFILCNPKGMMSCFQVSWTNPFWCFKQWKWCWLVTMKYQALPKCRWWCHFGGGVALERGAGHSQRSPNGSNLSPRAGKSLASRNTAVFGTHLCRSFRLQTLWFLFQATCVQNHEMFDWWAKPWRVV